MPLREIANRPVSGLKRVALENCAVQAADSIEISGRIFSHHLGAQSLKK
jgi:hypothetical protein